MLLIGEPTEEEEYMTYLAVYVSDGTVRLAGKTYPVSSMYEAEA